MSFRCGAQSNTFGLLDLRALQREAFELGGSDCSPARLVVRCRRSWSPARNVCSRGGAEVRGGAEHGDSKGNGKCHGWSLGADFYRVILQISKPAAVLARAELVASYQVRLRASALLRALRVKTRCGSSRSLR